MDPTQTVGQRIQARRLRLKMNLPQAARACGLSVPFFLRIERGDRTPSYQSLEKIAAGLKTGVRSLIPPGDA